MFPSAEFWSALAAIVVIDIVLAGDNAIVIALAARNLPKTLQRRAIVWGTAGAVVVRATLTVAVLWLLQQPLDYTGQTVSIRSLRDQGIVRPVTRIGDRAT